MRTCNASGNARASAHRVAVASTGAAERNRAQAVSQRRASNASKLSVAASPPSASPRAQADDRSAVGRAPSVNPPYPSHIRAGQHLLWTGPSSQADNIGLCPPPFRENDHSICERDPLSGHVIGETNLSLGMSGGLAP